MEATHDDVRFAVERRLVGLSTRSFPRPFTIYAGNVEDVSLGVGDFAKVLTNSGRRNQRRRERARRRRGTEARSAGRLRWAQTERRTETRSSTKDYAEAQDDAVNKRARKSMEGKELAPRISFETTTRWLTGSPSTTIRRPEYFKSCVPIRSPAHHPPRPVFMRP